MARTVTSGESSRSNNVHMIVASSMMSIIKSFMIDLVYDVNNGIVYD